MSFATFPQQLSAVRACDCCRQAKAKCSQGSPCQRCERLNKSCHYSEQHSASACDCCRQAKAKCSQGSPCQRCERLNKSCHYSQRRSACPRVKKKSSHGIHESMNAGGHSSNKQADRSKKAEMKNTSPTPLGATTPSRDHLSHSMPICTSAHQTLPADDYLLYDHLSHSVPICTSAHQTLPADDYLLYDPAMDGLGIVDVTGTVEDLARADASQSGLTLDTNSGYASASIMPSFMLPTLCPEDLPSHPMFSFSHMSSLPGTSLEGPMLDVNSSHGRAKEECSKEQPCDSVRKRRKTGTVFLCLFEQCNRATAEVGFPNRWNCYDHMQRVHAYDTPYDDYKLQARAVPRTRPVL